MSRKYLTVVLDVSDWSQHEISMLMLKQDVVAKAWGDMISREKELRMRAMYLEKQLADAQVKETRNEFLRCIGGSGGKIMDV